ncbi:MAG: T9SS type A sorting domain-containing protein [Paludibacter sp.]|nr:T9SS type A sorting domain-containing protein [Paludibacter sp.]
MKKTQLFKLNIIVLLCLTSFSTIKAQCGGETQWKYSPITPILNTTTTAFIAEFDATPPTPPVGTSYNGVLAFSNGAPYGGSQMGYPLCGCIVRFSPDGKIQARNGLAYAAVNSVSYSPGTKYHFKMTITVSTKLYSVTVTPAGGSEVTIATNYAFRQDALGSFGGLTAPELLAQSLWPKLDYFVRKTEICDSNIKVETLVVDGVSIDLGPTNINSLVNSNINIYPNPLTGNNKLTVDFGSIINEGNIEIFDINSKSLYKQTINNSAKAEIKQNFQSGMYLLKVYNGKNSYSQKIVVK